MLFALLAGCAPADNLDDTAVLSRDGDVAAERVMEEGSPEALGVIAMLNDASITTTVLDIDAALDKRAAQNIVNHRNGADGKLGTADDDLYGTVAEIDAISYVGDSALSALLAYAITTGWVTVDDTYYGTIESVSFTKDQAAAIVELVNTEDSATLDDDVGLDSRSVKDILAKRPYATLEDVAKAKYVGTSALNKLKDWVDLHSAPLLNTADAVSALGSAVADLWFSTEGDYRLTVWQITDPSTTVVTSSNVKTVIASVYVARSGSTALADRTVETSSLDWMFDSRTEEQSWWDDWYREQATKWTVVRNLLELQLTDVTVWRLGKKNSSGDLTGDIDVWVIGVTTDGDLVGLSTVAIET